MADYSSSPRLNTLVAKGGIMFFSVERSLRLYKGAIMLSPVENCLRRRSVYIKEYKYNNPAAGGIPKGQDETKSS